LLPLSASFGERGWGEVSFLPLLSATKHANPATAGASAGISTIHDELNSKNPGEKISNPVATVATTAPLTLRQRRNRDANKTIANPDVTNLGPSTDGATCSSTWRITNVCNNG
jgi:hypothetical protein